MCDCIQLFFDDTEYIFYSERLAIIVISILYSAYYLHRVAYDRCLYLTYTNKIVLLYKNNRIYVC